MAANLTQDEARARADLITVSSYRVELDLTGGETTFPSVTVVTFRCNAPGAGTFINLTAPKVREITLNGVPVSVDAFDGDRITLAGLAAENELRVVAECAYSRSGEGLHRFTDPADGGVYMYSDLETFDAHRIYACFDQPDLKATYELTVTAPDGWQVVSNMAPNERGPAGEAAARWHFPPTPVMSTYITAVAAGPYHIVRDSFEDIPLGIYCRQSLAEYLDPEEIFEVTRQGFGFYHAAFGVRYPFGKYDQLFVPEFKEGAMENAGCVTFLESYIFRSRVTDFARESRAETILHEMAHMWFGDLVTMRWWDDLWLNESFATWAGTLAEAEATRWTSAWTTFAQLYKAWAYRQDQLPSTHPDRRGHPRHLRGRGELRRDHLRQGRVRAQAARRVRGPGQLPGGCPALFRRARLGERHAGGPARRARGNLGPGPAPVVPGVAGDRRGEHTAPEYETDARRPFTSFAVRQEAVPEYPVLRSHRIAIGLYGRGPEGLYGGGGRRPTLPGR